MAEQVPFLELQSKEATPSCEDTFEPSYHDEIRIQRKESCLKRQWKDVILIVLTTLTLTQSMWIFHRNFTSSSISCRWKHAPQRKSLCGLFRSFQFSLSLEQPTDTEFKGIFVCNANIAIVDSKIDQYRPAQVRFISNYSALHVSEMEEVDKYWNNIVGTHGTVAVDREWAVENGLPPGEMLEADPTKEVYVLEAYHSLHCLTVIRTTLFQLARGEQLDVPFGHSTHCLFGLLQSVVCNADDALLYYTKNSSVGDGQTRMCRNWEALRDWAADHSACYRVDDRAIQFEDPSSCSKSDGLVMEGSFS